MPKNTDKYLESKMYLLRHDKSFSYVANSIDKRNRVFTPFLEYAMWFETKKDAEKYCLKDEWVDDRYKR